MKDLRHSHVWPLAVALLVGAAGALFADEPPADTSRGDAMAARYFQQETGRLAADCLDEIASLDQWKVQREEYLGQLREMLGLDPWPERTPLHPVITGRLEHDEFTVENLHFQSRPGLYVTGNLYLPKGVDKPAPAVLYVCGHARVKHDGISYGNKAHYQHHGIWFARHGYVCLVIDTLQLGEIEGIHHGTYRERMWWWLARGYTPAGVEAWNCVRALDYLQSRPEVDGQRLGVTGRSGGGAYSWWIAALDERIKCAVPVAGIVDLESHVVDGCVEGHCDCMYMLNTYRWDYPLVAALVAPRALLLTNTDKDRIFPLEGVVRTHAKVRRIYQLYGANDHFGLQISEGPHKDIQELQVAAFRWMNRFLKGEDPKIEVAAVGMFEPRQLKVFDELPAAEANTAIHETFVPLAAPVVPQTAADWQTQRDGWMKALGEKAFRAWPQRPEPLDARQAFAASREGVELRAVDFTSQGAVRLRLYFAQRAGLERPSLVVLNVLDEQGWTEFLGTLADVFGDELAGEQAVEPAAEKFADLKATFVSFPWAMAFVAPRGIGPTVWSQDDRKNTQIRRRFMLLGQTEDGMRVWDVRRAVQTLRSLDGLAGAPLWLQGQRQAAGIALYASLLEPDIKRLDLWHLPLTHREGPILLNVLRYLDLPQALSMAVERSQVKLYQADRSGWDYVEQVRRNLGWPEGQFEIRGLPGERPAEKPVETK